MHGSLFLPLLSLILSALPAVLCADDQQGTPTLIFESRFGDAKSPFLANVEVERLNNIKGIRTEVVGVYSTSREGALPPAVTGNVLEFFNTTTTNICGIMPGMGAGQIVYSPFRLDHNTVFNNMAQPVEDNAWIFSWRAAFGTMRYVSGAGCGAYDLDPSEMAHSIIYDHLNHPWQVLYSFPTKGSSDNTQSNLVIATRSRNQDLDSAGVPKTGSVELGVFVSTDPTTIQNLGYRDSPPAPDIPFPVAVFPVPEVKTQNWQWRNYVLYIPMPDRSTTFKVVGELVAGILDIPAGQITTGNAAPADWTPRVETGLSNTAAGVKQALRTIFSRQLDVLWGVWDDAFNNLPASSRPKLPLESNSAAADGANRISWQFLDAEFVDPKTVGNVGTWKFSFEIRTNEDRLKPFARQFVKYFAPWLQTQFLAAPYTFDAVNVNYRAPGALKHKDITLWFDGTSVAQSTYQHAEPKKIFNWLRVPTIDPIKNSYESTWKFVVSQIGGSLTSDYAGSLVPAFEFQDIPTHPSRSIYGIHHDPTRSYAYSFALSRVGSCNFRDFTTDIASRLAAATREFHYRLHTWGTAYPTAYGFTEGAEAHLSLGFVSPFHFDVKQTAVIDGPVCIASFVVRIRDPEDALGAQMVLNTDVDTGFSKKRQAPTTPVPFLGPYFVIGGHPITFLDETDVGPEEYKGGVQNLRLADVKIFTTAATTAKSAVAESFLTKLVECGDGELDAGEQCDKSDPTCTSDCTCPVRTIPKAPMGCTYCGNGVIDYLIGEVCDIDEDPWCAPNCLACADPRMVIDEQKLPSNGVVTQIKGRCSFCGNGALDISVGEICDRKDSNCNADCKSCKPGYFPIGNGVGSCTQCGNKKLEIGEVCDIGFNTHVCSSDCLSCLPGFVPDGQGSCTTCGNGVVDSGEACDWAKTACAADCSACVEFHVPAGGECTRCGNGKLDAGETCDSTDPNCSADCSGCIGKHVATEDALGSCSLCGNGNLDVGEACDADANCIGCQDCRAPFVLSKQGGVCVLCGNGKLDAGEVCDAAQLGCDSSCLSCGAEMMSVADAALNPTGLCFPTSCSGAPGADGECTCE